MNRGVVYALWDYDSQNQDELAFSEGDCMTVLRREDEVETEWWWARCGDYEGYIPRNLLGVRMTTFLEKKKCFFTRPVSVILVICPQMEFVGRRLA